MLVKCQGYKFQGSTTELNDEQLADEDTYDDQNEKVVVTDVSAYVDFVLFEFSGIEKVEHLQEHKNVEEQTQMNAGFWAPVIGLNSQPTFDSEQFGHEKDDCQDDHLEYGVKDDVSPHQGGDDVFVSGVWHSQ